MMQDNDNSKGKHLTELERQLIERWHNKEKLSNREIESEVCLPTLYNWIAKGILSVAYHDLLYPQYRKPKKQRMTQPKHILGLSIEQRPQSINICSEYGHWEIDTVLLTKEKGECLLTLTERKTRLEIIRLFLIRLRNLSIRH
ncbi:MAG: hypothetical protein Q4A90_10040 [Streptococcus sp.]|nr:hypothetical protein [Streptococcus sp.]